MESWPDPDYWSKSHGGDDLARMSERSLQHMHGRIRVTSRATRGTALRAWMTVTKIFL
jgi:hypothetical protein